MILYKTFHSFLALKKHVAFALSFILMMPLLAQEVTVSPVSPKMTDEITILFDATKGNQELKDIYGKVYFHAGLITNQSRDERDWKFVVGNWGADDARVEMIKKADNLYEASFVPMDLFGVTDDIKVNMIAFVFRDLNGGRVGKTAANTDIYVPIDGYKPFEAKPAAYLFNEIVYKNHQLKTGNLFIETDQGTIVVRPFSDSIVETSWHPAGFENFAPSHSVIMQPSDVRTFLAEAGDKIMYDLPGLQILVQKKPFKISYLSNGKNILSQERGFFSRTDGNGFRFKLDQDEKLYGSGGRASGINLRGRKLGLYNRPDYNYEFGATELNYMVPLLVSSEKYLLLVDNPHKAWFDVDSKGDGVLEFGAAGGPMRYFIATAKNYPLLMQQYSALTGLQPMLPRWAFGNLQSRMAYRTQKETTEIVDQMIAEDFPIDAIILDFYWFGDSILGHLGRLDWWKPSWPEPEKMIADFRSKGVKTITISEPYIIDTLANWQIANDLGILATDSSGQTYVDKQFYFGNGSLIDIFKPEAQQWLWKEYRKQFDIGIEGLWGDLGEPESHPSDMFHVLGKADEVHNIYGHYWSKTIFDNFRKDFPEKRLFFLARSGFAGTQRYGIVPWTGDVSRSWKGMKAQLPAMLNMSMSGVPYMHSDAGGFATGVKDDELYTRWLQFSVFTPILRPHGSVIPSEPIFFNDTTKRIVRHFMKLRYELLPYIYTAAWENSQTGLPITKPLFFYHPDDERFSESFESYYFGDNLLVIPVTESNVQKMPVELPKGLWYHFWSGQKHNGGRSILVQTALESIPVFVKAGSFIPRVPSVNTTDFYSSRNLVLHTYLPGADGNFSGKMFEDDGSSFGTYESGDYELLHFDGKLEKGEITIALNRTGKGWLGMPESRLLEVVVYGLEKKLKEIQYDGKKLSELEKEDHQGIKPGFWQDENGQWHIRVVWPGHETVILAK
jgi:oligosaccharide 4-alpha-D-glucosyltransferase